MTVQERIMNRLIQDPSGCWIWMGFTHKGYGKIGVEGKNKRVHRVMWELTNGPIPKGIFVLHKCDITECANPDHLFLGTHTDNMKDMINKGRKSKVVWNTGMSRCKKGHPLDKNNAYHYVYNGRKVRNCKTCARLRRAGG